MDIAPYDELKDTMDGLEEDQDEQLAEEIKAENKTTNATLAKVDENAITAEEEALDKELDGTFPISNATMAKIDEEGASDDDMQEPDDTDPDELKDQQEEPDEAKIMKEEEVEEKPTVPMVLSKVEFDDLNSDDVSDEKEEDDDDDEKEDQQVAKAGAKLAKREES